MSAVLDFGRALERQAANRADSVAARADAVSQRAADLAFDLNSKCLAAMTGAKVALPTYVCSRPGVPSREVTQPLIEHVMCALDAVPCAELLLKLLAESVCPVARDLRVAIAKQYAADNALQLAELEMQ